MKLLNHTSIYMAAILFMALSVWTIIFYFQMLDEIYDSLDDGLENQKILVINRAKKDPSVLQKETFQDGYYTIHKVPFRSVKDTKDRYRDTLMYMLNEEDYEPVRLLETAFEQDGKYYKLKVITSMVEEDDLIEDLLYSILWLYLGVMCSILLLNNVVLKKIWKPFYGLLERLKTFNVEKDHAIAFPKTNVDEFKRLNQNLEKLLRKSVDSFQNQKRFIENASHELQTPLAIAINKLELLVDTHDLQGEQLAIISTVFDNLERMARLNKTLLLLSKIENKQFPDEGKIQVNKLVQKIDQQFEDLRKHSLITLSIVNQSFLLVYMNHDLLVILLTNLIKNAILHTPKKNNITIIILNHKVHIQNTGERALDKKRLFNRFYKNDPSNRSTGLGLSIAKAICEQYGIGLAYNFEDKHIFTIDFAKISLKGK